jgi:hypothetical protein
VYGALVNRTTATGPVQVERHLTIGADNVPQPVRESEAGSSAAGCWMTDAQACRVGTDGRIHFVPWSVGYPRFLGVIPAAGDGVMPQHPRLMLEPLVANASLPVITSTDGKILATFSDDERASLRQISLLDANNQTRPIPGMVVRGELAKTAHILVQADAQAALVWWCPGQIWCAMVVDLAREQPTMRPVGHAREPDLGMDISLVRAAEGLRVQFLCRRQVRTLQFTP